MKEYYIPALVVGAVSEKRAKDQRTGIRKPPHRAAYIYLLQTGLLRFLSEPEFETAVLETWVHVQPTNTDCWQRVNLPISDELHTAVKAAAEFADRRLYDFAHCLLTEAVKSLDYSQIETSDKIARSSKLAEDENIRLHDKSIREKRPELMTDYFNS